METEGRVLKVFAQVFNLTEDQVKEKESRNEIESWDSIGHLQLVMNLELEFGIKLTTEDIVEMDSFRKCLDKVNGYLKQ